MKMLLLMTGNVQDFQNLPNNVKYMQLKKIIITVLHNGARMVQWQNSRLPRGRPGFDSRSVHFYKSVMSIELHFYLLFCMFSSFKIRSHAWLWREQNWPTVLIILESKALKCFKISFQQNEQNAIILFEFYLFFILSSSKCLRRKANSPKTKKISELAEQGFDPWTSGLWAQHASAAPLCCMENHTQ